VTRPNPDASRSPAGGANVDSVYYRDGVDNSLAMGVLRKARMSMFQLFMSQMSPTAETRILDIGVSDDENDGANFLEKHYPWQHRITCAGIGTGEAVLKTYPKVTFQQIVPGARLPFDDLSFDIACSNAVIEHVGGASQRTAFIAEHLRVAKMVFITFPNRWFPVEHHTSLPLIHYTPTLFRRLLTGTKYAYWTDPANMDFIDRRLIAREWPIAHQGADKGPPVVIMTGLPLGPFSSNVAVIWKRS
jgi:SAM-dependent methyltransferase